jgi:hypothetical protein
MGFTKGNLFQLVLAAVLMIVGVGTTLAQQKDRVIEWPTDPLGRIGSAEEIKQSPVIDALEIVDITVAGRSITVSKPFPANDDWLIRGLIFRMRNVSGKPIAGARIYFLLPETKTVDQGIIFSFEYGRGLSTRTHSDQQKVIMPNEEFELKFNDAQYDRSKVLSFSRVLIDRTVVKLDDGSSWSSGCLRSANPSNSCTPRSP